VWKYFLSASMKTWYDLSDVGIDPSQKRRQQCIDISFQAKFRRVCVLKTIKNVETQKNDGILNIKIY